jgi:hypothetical protein
VAVIVVASTSNEGRPRGLVVIAMAIGVCLLLSTAYGGFINSRFLDFRGLIAAAALGSAFEAGGSAILVEMRIGALLEAVGSLEPEGDDHR